jgi:outer membrane protein
MKSITFAALVAITYLASDVSAHAQARTPTLHMNKLFSSYYKTKDAESRINEARASAKKELDDRMDTYKKNLDSINKLNEEINKPELSKDKKDESSKKRDDMISETKNLEREIGEFRTTREKQLQEQAVRMRNGIVEEITKLVQDEVKTNNYDLVLDKSGSSLNGVPIVLYARESEDFSEKIITQLNKNKSKEGTAPTEKASPAPKK